MLDVKQQITGRHESWISGLHLNTSIPSMRHTSRRHTEELLCCVTLQTHWKTWYTAEDFKLMKQYVRPSLEASLKDSP